MTVERIYRWEIGLITAALLGATGVVFGQPAVILAAGIPLAYFTFTSINRLPEMPAIHLERELSESVPRPGERIEVTLTVRNENSMVLTDLRVVDAVPDELAVVDGTPRAALSLRPDTEATIKYTIVAMQGAHAFGDPYVRLRTVSGGRRQTMRIQADGTDSVSCFIRPTLPLDVGNTFRTGERTTATAGQGLEFHTLREYRSGDPINRIDWRRYAKTGDLTTVEFNEQRTTTVMVVLDLREEMRLSPHEGHPDGIELTAYAGYALFEELINAGHTVGVTGVGVNAPLLGSEIQRLKGGWAWIEPGTGSETKARVNKLYEALQEHLFQAVESGPERTTATSSSTTTATDGGTRVMKRFIQRLTTGTPVVIVSTAMDDQFVELARQLRMANHTVTFVSPDVTHRSGTGATIEALQRSLRLNRVRKTETVAVDWDPAEPLQSALESSGATLL
jgi:uncharacterized repeat protein (TIGR01451 family)